MAIADGTNPGRTGHADRQHPSRLQHGRGSSQGHPTSPSDQTPADIFGIAQVWSTGAGGSAGAPSHASDPTIQRGQLDDGLAMVSDGELTSTGAPGSDGARNSQGGETVTYTDFFGFMGQEHRETTVQGRVSGSGDWTQANDMGYDSGPTLPILQNARPTSSGAGQGRIRGAGRGL